MRPLPIHEAESILRGRILDDTPVERALYSLAGSPRGVARLLDLAHDPNAQVAWLGVEGLARAQPRSGLRWAVTAVFARAIRSGRTAARRAAVWGILEHGLTPLSRETLRIALGDRDAIIRSLAVHGLGRVPEPDLVTLQWTALDPLFDSDDPRIRARAYDAAGAAGLRPLRAALEDGVELEAELAPRAAAALRRLDSDAADGWDICLPWRDPVRPQTHRRLRGPWPAHPRARALEAEFLHDPTIDDTRIAAALQRLAVRVEPAQPPRERLVEAVVRPREAPVIRADQAPPHRVSINALIEWGRSGLESAALEPEPQQ